MFRDKETDLLKGEMYHIIKPDDHLHGTNGNTPRNRMSIVDDNKLNSITNGKLSIFFPRLYITFRSLSRSAHHLKANHSTLRWWFFQHFVAWKNWPTSAAANQIPVWFSRSGRLALAQQKSNAHNGKVLTFWIKNDLKLPIARRYRWNNTGVEGEFTYTSILDQYNEKSDVFPGCFNSRFRYRFTKVSKFYQLFFQSTLQWQWLRQH